MAPGSLSSPSTSPSLGVPARSDAEHEAALREVVEHGNPVCRLDRIVEVQQNDPGAEHDPFGLAQSAGDEQLRRGHVLPGQLHVLANPNFAEAEPVRPADQLKVFVIGIRLESSRRMQRHHEQADLHSGLQSGGLRERAYFIGTGAADGIRLAQPPGGGPSCSLSRSSASRAAPASTAPPCTFPAPSPSPAYGSPCSRSNRRCS